MARIIQESRTELRQLVLEALPAKGDWAVAVVVDYLLQAKCGDYRFYSRKSQWVTAKAICEDLCRAGLAERALGIGDNGRCAITYNRTSTTGGIR